MKSASEHRRFLGHLALLLSIALVLGLLANTALPGRIPWTSDWSHRVEVTAVRDGLLTIHTADAYRIWQAKTHVILDARRPADFEAGHIPEALSLPVDALDERFPAVQLLLQPQTAILVYCSGDTCDESLLLANFLRQQGYLHVVVLVDGFGAWQAAGYPCEIGQ